MRNRQSKKLSKSHHHQVAAVRIARAIRQTVKVIPPAATAVLQVHPRRAHLQAPQDSFIMQ